MSLEIIQRYKIYAKKSLGQNFLVDDEKVSAIASTIDIGGKNIVEVGPGYGALTEKLFNQMPHALHLVELDRDMIQILKERQALGELQTEGIDFQIHNSDVLDFTPEFQSYSVIANIPYYITSPILHHFLYELDNSPESMLILMQKDVGDKILGGKKNKSSVIKLMIDKKCSSREVLFVPKESFIPAPKVESSVLLFESHDTYSHIDDAQFLSLIKSGFAQPRKKLLKNLVGAGYDSAKVSQILHDFGYDENLRGEDLNIEQWIDLFLKLK